MNINHVRRLPCYCAIVLTLFLLPLQVAAQPLLNGLAVSTELGQERFIAALYADSLSTNASEVLNSTARRSMELKVVADRLSSRSLRSMWIEGMAINNPSNALKDQADNMATLTNMVRKRLVAGDTLRIESEVGNGTTVKLNDVTLGNIRDDDFFNMLLRTWIGSVPLSSEFRDGLLAGGNPDEDLANRYRAISPQEGRAEAVASWISPKEEPAERQVATAAPTVKPSPPRPQVQVEAAKPTLAALARPTVEAIQQDEQKKATVASSIPKQANAAQPQPEVEETAAETRQQPKPPQPENTVALATQPADSRPNLPVVDEDDEEDELFTAESILARSLYVSELMAQSRSNLEYPRRAAERRQEGSVRVSVIVNRDGSVKESTLVEESRHRLLNREVMSMIDRASPFPPMPEALQGEQFEFSVPISFKLQE